MAKCQYDWDAALEYRSAGRTLQECSEEFGFSPDAWYKAVARGVIKWTAKQNRGGSARYDWAEVQRYYDTGHSYRECRQRFGFAAETWRRAAARGEVQARAQGWSLEKLLQDGCGAANIKRRLLAAGLLEERCGECGLSEWRGKRLVIQIDHINGICTDNRLENLRMLCPNCHSQTETFGARNKVRQRKSHANGAALADGSPNRI